VTVGVGGGWRQAGRQWQPGRWRSADRMGRAEKVTRKVFIFVVQTVMYCIFVAYNYKVRNSYV
jgi:hypothetical protein